MGNEITVCEEDIYKIESLFDLYVKNTYRKNEMYEVLKNIEDLMVKETFGDEENNEACNWKSIYKSFCNFDLGGFNTKYKNEIETFHKYAEEASKKIAILRSGEKGENELARELENIIDNDIKYILNVQLSNKNEVNKKLLEKNSEVDALLITKKNIYIIECKRSIRNSVYVDKKGWYHVVNEDNKDKYKENLESKFATNKKFVINYIRRIPTFCDINIEDYIKNVIVFNNNAKVIAYDYEKYIHKTTITELVREINCEDKSDGIFNEGMITKIYNCFKDSKDDNTYEIGINLRAFIKSYAKLMYYIKVEKEKEEAETGEKIDIKKMLLKASTYTAIMVISTFLSRRVISLFKRYL